MKKSLKFAVAGLLVLVFGKAQAQTCAAELDLYNYYLTTALLTAAANLKAQNPSCFGAGATGASREISATLFAQGDAISRSVNSRLSGREGDSTLASGSLKGLAAGGLPQPWNLWGNYNQNETDVGYTTSGAKRIDGNSDIQNTILGIDYAYSPSFVAGLSVALDRGSAWSRNVTDSGPKLSNSSEGYTIAPYLGYQIDKQFTVDVSAGWGRADFSTATTTAGIDRVFVAGNLSYTRWVGNVQYTGKLSWLHGEEDVSDAKKKADGTTISRTSTSSVVNQARIGGQVGYWMNGAMPYAGLRYVSDVRRADEAYKDPTGRDAFVAALGLNFFSLTSKITGGILYEQEFGRSKSENGVLTANINFRF